MNMLDISSERDSDIRSNCRERLEALEHWLRRLIDDQLGKAYGDFFGYVDKSGNRIIRKKLVEQVESRRLDEPLRYPRKIDAVLLEDAVDIICKEPLFKSYFRRPLAEAFPDGLAEARTFMLRLLAPRNSLSHANAISARQAEQVICYTGDIIASIKKFYLDQSMHQEFNVPLILKVTDSFGNVFPRSRFTPVGDGRCIPEFSKGEEVLSATRRYPAR